MQLFVQTQRDVERLGEKATAAVADSGILWIAYPKKSAKVETDLTRDVGWDSMSRVGWGVVSIVSIDDKWSAMRFKSGQPVRPASASADSDQGAAKAPRVLDIPEDLTKALSKNARARKTFEALAYTHRKEYVLWITSAKREETRLGRVTKTVAMLEAGKKSQNG